MHLSTVHVWSGMNCDLTGVRGQGMDRGRACSHRGDLGLGLQRSLGDTCHTEDLLCCAGSSVPGGNTRVILLHTKSV